MKTRMGNEFYSCISQQDSSSTHNYGEVLAVIIRNFQILVLFTLTKHPWPARSPDFNVCDPWAWSYMKSMVVSGEPKNLVENKTVIDQSFAELPPCLTKHAIILIIQRKRRDHYL